jgi:hypothetical protein
MFRLERHRLGPRCYVLGQRIHEYQLGLGLLVAVAFVLVAEFARLSLSTEGSALVGGWLVAKDWRDIFPGKRDTAAWRLGLHKPPRD